MTDKATDSITQNWERLEAQIELAGGFWLGFVFSAAPQAVATLWNRTEKLLEKQGQTGLRRDITKPDELATLVPWLLMSTETQSADCVWIESIRADPFGAAEQPWTHAWEQLFLRMNERRDALRARLRGGLVFAAPPNIVTVVRDAAPDVWSVRSLSLFVDWTLSNVKPERIRKPVNVHPRRESTRRAPEPGRGFARKVTTGASNPFSFQESEQQAIEDLICRNELDKAEAQLNHAFAQIPPENELDLAFAYRLRALLHQTSGKRPEGIAAFRRGLEAYHDAAGYNVPVDWYESAARMALFGGDPDAAREFLSQAWGQCRLKIKNKETIDTLRDLATVLQTIGDTEYQLRNLAAAETAFDEAVIVSRRLMDLREDDVEHWTSLSTSLLGLGDVRRDKGDFAGAVVAFEETRKLEQRICNLKPEDSVALRRLSIALTRLGGLKQETGDLEQAKTALYEALAIRREIADTNADDPRVSRDLASVLSRIGMLELLRGDLTAAIQAAKESVALDRQFCAATSRSPNALHDLASSLFRLGSVYQKMGQHQDAREAFAEFKQIADELAAAKNVSGIPPATLDAVNKALADLDEIQRKE